jgi:hypothetical protein
MIQPCPDLKTVSSFEKSSDHQALSSRAETCLLTVHSVNEYELVKDNFKE